MNDPPSRDTADPSGTLVRRAERACDRFEAAWKAGQRPRVEDHLAGVPESERPALLRELILLEVDYRRLAGDRPGSDEFLARFPGLDRAWIAGVLSEGAADPATVPAAPPAGDPDDEPPAIAGYSLSGNRLGAGGMAVVWLGRDARLNRDVAVKVMRHRLHGRPSVQRRFEEEAQVASQLAHPAIPPVHELGELPDGRPYFVMKVVKGRTLAELLEARPGPADELPRFLGAFEQVCQAVAYAHSKGVIHRDLKPHNVMVGAFGEVQLMDWGLAKVLTQGGAADEKARPAPGRASAVRTARSGPDAPSQVESGTQEGSVLGTPAYMAPEQARGEVESLDERCDVFGLGAILCHILTGQPPFAGSTQGALARAQAGAVTDALARLDGCGADAELLALAKGCLAPEPDGRPRTGEAVARALGGYLESVATRLRRAELERAAAEARAVAEARTRRVAEAKAALERRARRLAVGLAAAGLLLVTAAALGTWWLRERQRRTDMAVAVAMGEARQRFDQARAAPRFSAGVFRECLEAARQAEELARTGGASQDVRRQAADLAAQLTEEAEAAERDGLLLTALLDVPDVRKGPGGYLATADEQLAAAFRDYGLDLDVVPTAEAAARLAKRPRAVVREVVAALDLWARDRRRQRRPAAGWQRLTDLAAALDEPDPRRQQLRQKVADGSLERERALGMLAMALRPVPVPFDAGLGPDRAWLRDLTAATNPADEPVLGLLVRARALLGAGDEARAERLLRDALRQRPQEAALHVTLGQLLEDQGRGEAVECYAAARALRPELGALLAEALARTGRADEGLALAEYLAAEQPHNPWRHFVRGNVLLFRRQYKEAEAAYDEALRIKADYPRAHFNRGMALLDQGRYKEAGEAFHQAATLRPDLAAPYLNLGTALRRQNRLEEAEAMYRKAIALDPDDPAPHNDLGDALFARGKLPEAELAFRKAIALRPDFAQAHYNLGVVLYFRNKPEAAEAAWRETIRLIDEAREKPKREGRFQVEWREVTQLQSDYASAHFNLGNLLFRQNNLAGAEAAFRKAIAAQPDHSKAYQNLGLLLRTQGRLDEAEGTYRKASDIDPGSPQAHRGLALVLREQGRFVDSLRSMRRYDELGRKQPGWREPSDKEVTECERLVALDRQLSDVLEGRAEPASASEGLEYASLCQLPCKRLHRAAARLAADAFAADPRLADDLAKGGRYNAACSAALAAAGRAADAQDLPDKVGYMLRRQALGWLRADLELYAKRAEQDDARAKQVVRQRLSHWRQDSDLAPVRDGPAPDTWCDEERKAWRQLWEDAGRLLQKVEARR
jgi:serine/threonine-protein kinase